MSLGTLASTRRNILSDVVGDYKIKLQLLCCHGDYDVGVLEQCITGTLPVDSARFVIARSFNKVLLDYPLQKLLP